MFIAGDSISVCNTTNGGGSPCDLNWTYAAQYAAANNLAREFGYARGGSGLPWLALQRDAMVASKPPSGRWVVSVLIGANDLSGGDYADAQDYFTRLVAITDSLRSAGARVVVGTVLPVNGNSLHNARRAQLNAQIRAGLGTKFDAVADFAALPDMGCDSCAANLTYFSDGVHPTGTGHSTMQPVYKAAVERAFQ